MNNKEFLEEFNKNEKANTILDDMRKDVLISNLLDFIKFECIEDDFMELCREEFGLTDEEIEKYIK